MIAAASQLQLNPQAADFVSAVVDTYLWRPGLPALEVPEMSADLELGELWCVGAGSVGSCSLFFLSLATRAFQAVLVDRDTVGVENVTRFRSLLVAGCFGTGAQGRGRRPVAAPGRYRRY